MTLRGRELVCIRHPDHLLQWLNLLAIPAIGGASALELWELSGSEQSVDWISVAVGLVIAAVSAYFCIKFFLATIQRIGMLPFMIYRLILATVIVLSMV